LAILAESTGIADLPAGAVEAAVYAAEGLNKCFTASAWLPAKPVAARTTIRTIYFLREPILFTGISRNIAAIM